MNNIKSVFLIDGYHFSEETLITPAKIMEHRQAVGWGVESEDVWLACISHSLAVVGVEDSSGLLVGVGFLTGSIRHAVLCDLVVHPDHQGRGIGKAILDKRMSAIEALGVKYVYTDIVNTNPLKQYYIELGFENSSGSMFLNRAIK